MGKALGDIEHVDSACVVAGVQVKSGPFSEVWGASAKVDCDIPDMAGEHADEFALGLAELIMETAKNTLGRERLIVLNEAAGQSGGGKGGGVIEFGKPTATILKQPGLK